MKKLLYVAASPRGSQSNSRRLADFFIEKIQERHPGIEIETIDLCDYGLPELDASFTSIRSKLQARQELSAVEMRLWLLIQAEVLQFESADLYLFSTPMWNFSMPFTLKHYLDVITQPGSAFLPKADGTMEGNFDDKPAVLLYSAGGNYQTPEFAGRNGLVAYWERWTQFVGLRGMEIGLECTDIVADHAAIAAAAIAKVEKLVDGLDF